MRIHWVMQGRRLLTFGLLALILASAPVPALVRAQTTPTPPAWPHWEVETGDVWSVASTEAAAATATTTPTPSPTPEPTPEFASHFPSSRGSKLTLHFVRTTPASYQFLRDTTPPIVKLVDDLGVSATVRRDFPGMLIIGRSTKENRDTLRLLDPIRAATQYVNEQLPTYRANPDVDFWEGWNEFDPRTPDEWNWYAQFEGQRACLMQYYGYRTVVGNFSTGRPEFNEMLMFLPALRIGLHCGAIFGLHEYSAPTMQFGFAMRIPRRPFFADRGILTGRYRFWYEDMLRPLNVPIALVITETGVDGGAGAGWRPGPTGNGWLDFTGYWQQQGVGHDGPRAYAEQLAWYDSILRQDPYVLGATIYSAGVRGSNFDSFDIDSVLPYLTPYVSGIKGK